MSDINSLKELDEVEKLKLAWNRHTHEFLATNYRSGSLDPLANPQFFFTRKIILEYIDKKNPNLALKKEQKIIQPLSLGYFKTILSAKRKKGVFLRTLFGSLLRVAGDFRWQRVKGKTVYKASLLDIGCGSGNYYESFKLAGLHHFLEYKGVDIAEKNIENCRKLYPGIAFEVGNATRLTEADNAFDVVMANQLFEHLPPDMLTRALTEALRVTKELLIINFFCEKDIPNHHIIPKDGLYYWNCLSRKKIKEILAIGDRSITIVTDYAPICDTGTVQSWYLNRYPVSYSTWIISKTVDEGQ